MFPLIIGSVVGLAFTLWAFSKRRGASRSDRGVEEGSEARVHYRDLTPSNGESGAEDIELEPRAPHPSGAVRTVDKTAGQAQARLGLVPEEAPGAGEGTEVILTPAPHPVPQSNGGGDSNVSREPDESNGGEDREGHSAAVVAVDENGDGTGANAPLVVDEPQQVSEPVLPAHSSQLVDQQHQLAGSAAAEHTTETVALKDEGQLVTAANTGVQSDAHSGTTEAETITPKRIEYATTLAQP